MKKYSVRFAPEAEEQLLEIYRYIARAASAETAKRFTDAIVERCEKLATLPFRGTRRDDVRKGLRIIGYKKRVAIAFLVEEDAVSIVGIFYGGRDYEAYLGEDATGYQG